MSTFKYAFLKNFGCKVNQSESESLMRELQNYLYFVDNVNLADIIFVNSCAVTDRASKKTLTFIKNVKKNYPEKKLIVMGCLSYLLKEKRVNHKIDLIVSNEDKQHIGDILTSLSYTSQSVVECSENIHSFRTRAFLKIQDGCDNFCSYCIIPFLRGAPISKSPNSIINELKNLLVYGYKEVVLVGIHLGKYGIGSNNKLSSLLSLIEKIGGDFRVRLSSIEINELDEDLIDIIAGSNKICHHLHIPLQSGSNKILKLMNRKYDSGKFIGSINKLFRKIPDISIGFDVIAGFPGESESDFNETFALIKEIKPHYLHVFPYSDRPYTKACDMTNKVDKIIIKDRVCKLRELGKQLKVRAYQNKLGKKLRVLVEKDYVGYSDDYFKVKVDKGDVNSFCCVIINECNMKKVILGGTNVKENFDNRGFCSRGISCCESEKM